jgi:hypothetical protein
MEIIQILGWIFFHLWEPTVFSSHRTEVSGEGRAVSPALGNIPQGEGPQCCTWSIWRLWLQIIHRNDFSCPQEFCPRCSWWRYEVAWWRSYKPCHSLGLFLVTGVHGTPNPQQRIWSRWAHLLSCSHWQCLIPQHMSHHRQRHFQNQFSF